MICFVLKVFTSWTMTSLGPISKFCSGGSFSLKGTYQDSNLNRKVVGVSQKNHQYSLPFIWKLSSLSLSCNPPLSKADILDTKFQKCKGWVKTQKMCNNRNALFSNHLNLGARALPLAMRCSEDDPWCDQNPPTTPTGLVVPAQYLSRFNQICPQNSLAELTI